MDGKTTEEFLALKAVTESIILTIKQLTVQQSSHLKPVYQQVWKNSQQESYFKLYQIFSKFLFNFSQWQKKVEKQLTNIEQSQKKSQNNANNINLFQPHNLESTNTSSSGGILFLFTHAYCFTLYKHYCHLGEPYYVIVGDRPSNVEKLNSIIKEYYLLGGRNQTNNSEPQNSPMIIKLVN